MIHSKNKNNHIIVGFSLIEVLIALAIITVVLTPIFIAQSALMRATFDSSWLIDRIMHAHHFFFDAQRAIAPDTQQITVEKRISKPPTILKYTIHKVPDNSVLKGFKDIYIERVTCEYMPDFSTSSPDKNKFKYNRIGTFIYKPASKKE